MKRIVLFFLIAGSFTKLVAQQVKPFGPLPSKRQSQWQDAEFYLFLHFGPNTFTDLEWGKGTETEEVFNPTELDCRQWCSIAKAAGAKGLILTAKHHDGFCLWPSKLSTHTVEHSKWKNGKGDVLKELSKACKDYGLKLGIYLSPWDRNHPKYGTPAYNDVFVGMMKEIVERYGPFFEFWWDGANGEGPNGKIQVYDWNRFEKTIRTIAPNTAVFSDIGPDIRWIGNENGIVGYPNWSLLDTAGFKRGAGAPPNDTLNHGNVYGRNWMPAECDVSIRPGWFYHQRQDDSVKTAAELFGIYLKSVGRGAHLLLNVPPDRRGLINAHDSAALMQFKQMRDDNFGESLLHSKNAQVVVSTAEKKEGLLTDRNNDTYVSLGDQYAKNYIEFKFTNPVPADCVVLQEPIEMGQRVQSFIIETKNEKGEVKTYQQSTIGARRIATFPKQLVLSIRIYVTASKAAPLISEADAFMIDDSLIER